MKCQKNTKVTDYHYVLDAALLLDTCRKKLAFILLYQTNEHVLELDQVLLSTEQLVHYYLLEIIEQEEGNANLTGMNAKHMEFIKLSELELKTKEQFFGKDDLSQNKTFTKNTMMDTAKTLRCLVKKKQKMRRKMSRDNFIIEQKQEHKKNPDPLNRKDISSSSYDGNHDYEDSFFPFASQTTLSPIPHYEEDNFSHQSAGARNINISDTSYNKCRGITNTNSKITATQNHLHPERSAEDSLLFRLVVVLQLCLVRIEEAESIIFRQSKPLHSEDDQDGGGSFQYEVPSTIYTWMRILSVTAASTSSIILFDHKYTKISGRHNMTETMVKSVGSITVAIIIRRIWMVLCMNARLAHSMLSLEDWQQQWTMVLSVGDLTLKTCLGDKFDDSTNCRNEQSKKLLELLPFESTTSKSSIWHNYGALRFGMIKWAMNTLYASVGTAMQVSKKKSMMHTFLMPLYVAGAATYYALTGPSNKSQQVTNSVSSSPDLIRNTWGVVSLPAIKTFSLQASRLLKGAAIAEKVTICGVTCFILSKHPCPFLRVALNRFHRKQQRQVPHLHTILETCSFHDNDTFNRKAVNLGDYPKKDVIFHLTGGGFFAHTIAGDVPFLMDWSGTTNAIVICPEYALLPDHAFPVAIEQVTNVYVSIISGNTANILGFKTNRIIVTGESTGGNLAAALCVKLCMDKFVDNGALIAKKKMNRNETSSSDDIYPIENTNTGDNFNYKQSEEAQDYDEIEGDDRDPVRLPDAIMLSCPVLNLSLDISPFRLRGAQDPVLPGGLISTISDAYVPSYLGVDKQDPLASPYFAPDSILRIFPSTLLYVSSEDPLLDDSVIFNKRLRHLGVDSDLRAAVNMPHAYWGLGTAGFPEARKVQKECQDWMVKQLGLRRAKQ